MIEIKQGVELPKKKTRGRPKGFGRNFDLLKKLKPGDTVWNVGARRMRSIIVSARKLGVKITARHIPGTRSYAFQLRKEEPNDI